MQIQHSVIDFHSALHSDAVHTACTGPGAPFCDTRFLNVLRSTANISEMARLTSALSETATHIGYEIHHWQLLAAAYMLSGQHCFVITATGSGKTFCYQSVLLHQSDTIVAVICPLITLMEDQVAAARNLGLSAVALHAENLLHHEQLITDVAKGVYRLVLLGPEFCVPGNPHWMCLTKDCVFRRRLLGIVIDEAHLCHAWRDFRPRIDGLFRLNSWFNIPLMVMSATMTPYVRQYVHTGLRLPGHVPLIHRSIDRPEMYLSVKTIQHPVATFKDLDFLLPSSVSQQELIPTIVFADSQLEVSTLCRHFWSKAPPDWYHRNPFTFAAISTGFSQERRMLILKAMRAGMVKILFATQIAEVGLDFGTVARVVQWRVPLTLSGAGLWQRWGRACRRKDTIGVGIVFVSSATKIPSTLDHPLALLRTGPQDATVDAVLQSIYSFDSGTKRKDFGAGAARSLLACPLQDDTPYELNPVVAVAHHHGLEDGSSESHDDIPDGLDSVDDCGQPADTLPDFDHTAVDPHQPQAGKSRAVPMLCRLILWIVNTSGCIRECFLRYFDEAGFDGARYSLTGVDRLPTPCCDRHTPFDQLPMEYAQLMPEYHHPITASSSTLDASQAQATIDGPSKRCPVLRPTAQQSTAIAQELRSYRRSIWNASDLGGPYSIYPSYKLLSEQQIQALVKQAGQIYAGSTSPLAVLKLAPTNGLQPHEQALVDAICAAWDSATAPAPSTSDPSALAPSMSAPSTSASTGQTGGQSIQPQTTPNMDSGTSVWPSHTHVASVCMFCAELLSCLGSVAGPLKYPDESQLPLAVQHALKQHPRPRGRPSRVSVQARQQLIAELTAQFLAGCLDQSRPAS
jgi:hypothetical protein